MTSRIIELRARNFKRLQAVRIRPDGNTVIIGGRNAQGKTSILDAIWAALGGGRAVPEEPIRRGKSKAEIVLELDDLIITRKFSHAGSKLEVTTREGTAIRSPQGVLDKLTGSLTFDPLAFCRMSASGQAETLRLLAGLDLSDLDEELAGKLDARKDAKRDLARFSGIASQATTHEGVPRKVLIMADLLAEVETADKAAKRVSDLQHHEARLDDEAADLSRQIKELEEKVEGVQDSIQRVKDAIREAPDLELAKLEAKASRDKLANAEELNEKIRDNMNARAAHADVDKATDKAETLDEDVKALRGARLARIEAATFPVEGLAVDDEAVTYNGIAFEQASGAEKIRVSAAIGLAMNPELRVLLIRDGSLLDKDSLSALAEVAEEAEAQIWIERVGDGEEVGVVIEDGEVAEERTAANE